MTLIGKLVVIVLSILAILLLIGAARWAAPRLQDVDLPFLDQPTPTSVVPTSTPRPTATPLPEPTATPTSTVNFPAYWADGMWQDANEQWWPADDVREEVIGTIKQHYLEIYDNAWNLTNDEMYETLSDQEVEAYLTGQHLEDYLLTRQKYRETGNLTNQKEMVVTERKLTVRDFFPNGQSCVVADMYRDAYLLKYDPSIDSWNKVEIPEDGLLDGTQYLGTALYRMEYDPEDGRWKQESLLDWLPRP
jgi:hypothetical protein